MSQVSPEPRGYFGICALIFGITLALRSNGSLSCLSLMFTGAYMLWFVMKTSDWSFKEAGYKMWADIGIGSTVSRWWKEEGEQAVRQEQTENLIIPRLRSGNRADVEKMMACFGKYAHSMFHGSDYRGRLNLNACEQIFRYAVHQDPNFFDDLMLILAEKEGEEK